MVVRRREERDGDMYEKRKRDETTGNRGVL